MRATGIAVVCAAAVLIAGCSSDDPPAAPPGEPAPSKVVHPKADVPKDRDQQAVLAALRRLDPCSLLDTAGAEVPGYPADGKPVSDSPFSCYRNSSDRSNIAVASFSSLPERSRFEAPLLTIGPAKAYLLKERPCTVALPVSFTKAIEIMADAKARPAESCATAKAFATIALGKLTHPEAIQVQPFWDACTALQTAAGGSYQYDGGLASCEFQQDAFKVRLSFSHGQLREPASETVGGVAASVKDGNPAGNGCDVKWRHARARTTYPTEGPDLLVSINMVGCDRAKVLAEQVMKVLATPPPQATPQQPIWYSPSEPDVAVPGGCAFATKPKECQPYVQVPAPANKAEILRGAQADPNVDCRLAIEAVGKRYTEPLQAVTVPEPGCRFVEPTKTIRIEVVTNPAALSKRDRAAGDRDATIGGRPARVLSSENSYTVVAALSGNADESGTLQLKVDGPAAARDVPKVEGLVVDILTKFFN